jgi:putative hydrolase of the HAD superfamily
MFKAIGFDIDGTLYPSFRLYRRMLPFALSNLPLMRAFARTRKELRELAKEAWYKESAPENAEDFYRFQAHLTALKLKIDESKSYLLIRDLIYIESDELFSRIRPFPGVVATLEAIRKAGIPMGALSDFPTSRKLELLGLSGYFGAQFSSESTGFLKPAPEPFLALASALGVDPNDMLYVGNSHAYDVEGARGVGMKTAMVTRMRRGKADFEFFDYRDLGAFALRGLPQ